ncbi:hypothetical protein [Anaerostipes caccae]|uniref:hypothetical protein n=1 Tax=Anaerostipes caccae TaxID=105841 RepID=UPI001F18C36B|nr:hypothetical protein [Anaerostipes caccae]
MNLTEFKNIVVTEENADRFFTDAEEMIGWIDQPSLVPFMQYVPEELKEAFRNEVIDATLERAIQPDGTCFQPFRRLKVSAVK